MDFNKEEVEKLIIGIKAKVFDYALDNNLSTKDAVEEVQKVENETREFLEKEEVKETVKELKKINKKLKKVEENQKKLEEETPELKTVQKGYQRIIIRSILKKSANTKNYKNIRRS